MNTSNLILVALDEANRSTPALRRAAELGRRTGASLHLLSTFFDWEAESASELVSKEVGRLARKACVDKRLEALADLAESLRSTGLKVRHEVLWSGKPHDAILARTLDLQPDLVVRDLGRDQILGRLSTIRRTDWKLARQCPAPLMLVQKAGILLPKRIAAAVDPFHPDVPDAQVLDDKVVRAALPLAMASEAELQLVHVCPYRGKRSGSVPGMVESLARLRRDNDETYMAFAKRHGVPDENRVLLSGDPGHALLEFVDSQGIDLIVMGSEYRTGFERFMIGSTAEAVIANAACDILLVRPEGFTEMLGQQRNLEELRALYQEA